MGLLEELEILGFAYVVCAIFCSLLCISIAPRKRRSIWRFALFGLIPIIGPLIAYCVPARRDEELNADEHMRQLAAMVKLSAGDVVAACNDLGEIAVRYAVSTADPNGQFPELSRASQMLRLKAALVGANAIAQVRYTRTSPNFWRMQTDHVIEARGRVVKLSEVDLMSLSDDAERHAQTSDRGPIEEEMVRYFQQAGKASIMLGICNGLMAVVDDAGINWPFVIIAIVQVSEGFIIIGSRKVRMFLIDAAVLLLIALANLSAAVGWESGSTRTFATCLGVAGLLASFWALGRYGAVKAKLEEAT